MRKIGSFLFEVVNEWLCGCFDEKISTGSMLACTGGDGNFNIPHDPIGILHNIMRIAAHEFGRLIDDFGHRNTRSGLNPAVLPVVVATLRIPSHGC